MYVLWYFPSLAVEIKEGESFLSVYSVCGLGQQNISGTGNPPRSGWDVGRDQAQSVELHGEQWRDGPSTGMLAFC